ncbi:MAG: TldD/PmbA family protein, partial [Candidatus Margulisbacteria bacterium]|nr:TldD/PmbA family protein [Candidatus Margulisiibacteriota bacterium]
MLEQLVVKAALNIALDAGHKFAEIFAEHKIVFSAGLDNGKLERIRSGLDAGCGFRIINGKRTYYGFVNSLRSAEILDLARRVSRLAQSAGKKRTANFSCRSYQATPQKMTEREKMDLLAAAEKTARGHSKKICQATVRLAESWQKILAANTDGVWSEDERLRRRFFVQCVARGKNGDLQTGYESAGFTASWGDFNAEQAAQLATLAAARAELLLSAARAPAGTMPVVLSGEAGGTMIHEACGHALEADFIYKKTSIFTDKLGARMFPQCVTIIDDGTMPGLYGSGFCDDEGTLCRKNILINAGQVTGFMSDRLYAGL